MNIGPRKHTNITRLQSIKLCSSLTENPEKTTYY